MNVFNYFQNELVSVKLKDKKDMVENVYITNFIEPFFIEITSDDHSFLINLNEVISITKQEYINKINSFNEII